MNLVENIKFTFRRGKFDNKIFNENNDMVDDTGLEPVTPAL